VGVRSDDSFDGSSTGENTVRHDSKQALDKLFLDPLENLVVVLHHTAGVLAQLLLNLDRQARDVTDGPHRGLNFNVPQDHTVNGWFDGEQVDLVNTDAGTSDREEALATQPLLDQFFRE
jgi:hypothetical protein